MGQLEVYNINETILSGFVATVANNYISESNESSTFESYKAYFYSGNKLLTSKLKKHGRLRSLVITNTNGVFKGYQIFDFLNANVIKVTKTIDDFNIWQDNSLTDTKIDENIVRLQQKYGIE